MNKQNVIEDSYLGDGVYASFDGYGIVLDLRGQDTTTRIVLEPGTMMELNNYAKKIDQLRRNINNNNEVEE